MSEYAYVTMRVDKDLMSEAQRLFSELGLDMTYAYNMFLVQAVRTQSIPFPVALDIPNRATVESIEDIMNERNLSKPYSDIDELLRDLNARCIASASMLRDRQARRRPDDGHRRLRPRRQLNTAVCITHP